MPNAEWVCINPKCGRKSIEATEGAAIKACRYCGSSLLISRPPVPEEPPRKYFCPDCHRRFSAPPGAPPKLRCPNCRSELKPAAAETVIVSRAKQPLLLRSETRALAPPPAAEARPKPIRPGAIEILRGVETQLPAGSMSRAAVHLLIPIAEHLFYWLPVVAALYLWLVWYDSSSAWSRVPAVGALAAIVWWLQLRACHYRPQWRRAVLVAAWIVFPVAFYFYATTARETIDWRDGDLQYQDIYSWTDRPLHRTIIYNGEKSGAMMAGPLSPSGKPHGAWVAFPPARRVWFWYGDEVSEGEWHLRNR